MLARDMTTEFGVTRYYKYWTATTSIAADVGLISCTDWRVLNLILRWIIIDFNTYLPSPFLSYLYILCLFLGLLSACYSYHTQWKYYWVSVAPICKTFSAYHHLRALEQ